MERVSSRRLTIAIGAIAIAAILGLVLAVVAQAKAADAQTRAAAVAKDQATDSAQQAQKLRDAICGTFVDVSRSPITAQTTQLGRNLIRDTAHGADVAQCPR